MTPSSKILPFFTSLCVRTIPCRSADTVAVTALASTPSFFAVRPPFTAPPPFPLVVVCSGISLVGGKRKETNRYLQRQTRNPPCRARFLWPICSPCRAAVRWKNELIQTKRKPFHVSENHYTPRTARRRPGSRHTAINETACYFVGNNTKR